MNKYLREKGRKIIEWVKRNWIYINMGFLLAGILIMLVSYNRAERVIDHGGAVSGIFFAIWFITFPYLSRDKKDKAINVICKHFLAVIIIIIFVCTVSLYYFNNNVIPNLRADIICGILSVIILSYFVYIFKSFLWTFFYYVKKVAIFIDPRLEDVKKGTMNIIQGITAFLLTLTGFVGGIVGFIACIESLLKYTK